MDVESVAKNLFNHIYNNDIREIDKCLGVGDSTSWRPLIRYEFDIVELLGNPKTPIPHNAKLLSYEITTLSSFHLAALLGLHDILVSLLDKDIPVDMPLKSGTTALHIASFGGHLDTVKLLLEIYKADITKQDKYGWSALHYASTEGHLEVVELLVNSGIDIQLRDQDGTTAAFRAQVNHHEHVVVFLCNHGAEDELLNVEEEAEQNGQYSRSAIAALYAKPNKKPKAKSKSLDDGEDDPDYETIWSGVQLRQRKGPASRPPSSRRQSAPGGLGLDQIVPSPVRHPKTPSSQTMPVTRGRNTVRRLLRRELELAFGADGYELPANIRGSIPEEDELETERIKFGRGGIGVNTLKGILRDEFIRYRHQVLSPGSDPFDHLVPSRKSADYEKIYHTLGDLPPSPPPPGAPPLPPRNPSRSLDDADAAASLIRSSASLRLAIENNDAALTESLKKVACRLGSDWKKLAHALPLECSAERVRERIRAIESSYPEAVDKQAHLALAEWRLNRGREAQIDDLIVALRKAGLGHIIPDVEKVTQEFTA